MAALEVVSTRFLTSDNAAKHRTDRFKLQQTGKAVVFRRGSPFLLEISFNRTFNRNKDTVKIDVAQGELHNDVVNIARSYRSDYFVIDERNVEILLHCCVQVLAFRFKIAIEHA